MLLLSMCLLMPPPSHSANGAVGEVVSFNGIVRVEREGKSWQVTVGEEIQLHDQLKTGTDSRAEILFVDESRVRMAPNSTLEITEYLFKPVERKRKSKLSLWAGKARFIVNDLFGFKEKGYVVQTQNATAGTRGTDFVVEYSLADVPRSQARHPALAALNNMLPVNLSVEQGVAARVASLDLSNLFAANEEPVKKDYRTRVLVLSGLVELCGVVIEETICDLIGARQIASVTSRYFERARGATGSDWDLLRDLADPVEIRTYTTGGPGRIGVTPPPQPPLGTGHDRQFDRTIKSTDVRSSPLPTGSESKSSNTVE